MRTRTKDYRETLANFQVHTKTGKEAFLNEVAKWWYKLYPAKAEWFKLNMKRLRQVTTYNAAYQTKHGEFHVKMRVPQELWLFIQRWIPDFGKDSADLELLTRVFGDLIKSTDRRQRNQMYVEPSYRKEPPRESPSSNAEGAPPTPGEAGQGRAEEHPRQADLPVQAGSPDQCDDDREGLPKEFGRLSQVTGPGPDGV